MQFKPLLAMLAAGAIGAASGILAKTVGLPAASMTFFRVAIPALILGGYFLFFRRVKLFSMKHTPLFLASVINAPRMFLFYFAYMYTSLANGVIILYTWPIWGAVFGFLILKERVTRRTLLLLGLSFVGIVIMYSGHTLSLTNKDIIGMSAMLVSSMLGALMIVIFKKKINDHSTAELVFHQNFISALIFIPFIAFTRPAPTLAQAGMGIMYGFMVGIIAWFLLYYALRHLSIAEYGLFSYNEVIFAVLYGILFFGEVLTMNLILGGLCIIVAGYLIQRQKRMPVPVAD